MISLPLLGIVIGALGLVWWFARRENGNGKYKAIPGPMGLPVLGNILQLGNSGGMQHAFKKWADQYGKIFRIKLGNRNTVVISDPKWLKELFSMEFMTGRELFEDFNLYEEPFGITNIEGEMWEVHRRFLLRNLRDFGYGKSKLGDKILSEVSETLERLKEFESKPLTNLKDIILVAVINSLWQITGSQRFEQDDMRIIEMQKMTNKLVDDTTKYAIALFVPWTKRFMPKLDLEPLRNKAEEFYGSIIKEHEDTLQEDSPRDFIDMYLIEMRKEKDNPKSQFYGARARRQLMVVVGDIMFAGTDTTSMTLQWSLLFLTKFKHCQEKVQKEIEEITGNSRLVTLSDRSNMPYTLATIDEILRIASVASTGLQRRAKETKEFKGYLIEENSWVYGNLQYIHHSEEIWGDPKTFRPERFLSEDGKKYVKNENLTPFSTGKRQCIGEPLARDSVFMFLTNILQRYSTRFDPSQPEPSLKPKINNLFNGPPDYNLLLKDRLTK